MNAEERRSIILVFNPRSAAFIRVVGRNCGMIAGRMIDRTTRHRKAKKSYTLSPESLAFLEATRKRRRAASISAILEEILQAARREFERASLERAVAGYYGSLSDGEARESAAWGDFAMREFPNEVA